MQWVTHARWSETWTELAAIEGGGQGAAKRARRTSDGQEAFVKILSRNRDVERRARFFREATAYSMFQHPGVPRLVESNAHLHAEPEPALYIATEWIEGPTLRRFIDDQGVLGLRDGTAMISALLDTLRLCHQQDVVHRDIKPDNLILRLGNPGDPVLLDFGLTYHEGSETDFRTEEGQEIGNRFLRLPELSANSPLKQDSRSDLTFAAGLLLYALTGFHPDVLVDGNGRLPHQRDRIYERVRTAGGDDIARLLNFFDTAFAPRMSDRFSSAVELGQALGRMTGTPTSGSDDVAALRNLLDTGAARRARAAVEQFSAVLRFAWNLHEPLIEELGGTLDLVQSGWTVDAEAGRITLAFRRKGEAEAFLSNTFLVQQAGDELTLVAAGEPLLRTDAAAPVLDEAARQGIRAFLTRRLNDAISGADPLPPEAEFLETAVSPTLAVARGRALEEGKPIYAVYYDDRQPRRGELQYGVTQYFGTKRARSLLAANFVVALVHAADAAAADASLAGKSMEKARWAIFDADLRAREDGVLDRNANDGERMIGTLVERFRS